MISVNRVTWQARVAVGVAAEHSKRVAEDVAAEAAEEGRELHALQLGRFLEAAPHALTPLDQLDEPVWTGAKCATGNPEEWFTPYGETVSTARAERSWADRICTGCPVRAQCLALSLGLGEYGAAGVWGGLSQGDRRQLRPLWVELGRRLAAIVDEAAPPAVAS